MPKNQLISPEEARRSGEITFKPIPVMQYIPDYAQEVEKYGEARLKKMYYDMLVIREFETMLNLIKTQGSYQGIAYNHPGPAPLSIGQEAAAVGRGGIEGRADVFGRGTYRSVRGRGLGRNRGLYSFAISMSIVVVFIGTFKNLHIALWHGI